MSPTSPQSQHNKSLPWDEVEKQIYKEIDWFRNTIDVSPASEKNIPIESCSDCLFRRIAISIISDKLSAKEVAKSPTLSSFWEKKQKNVKCKKMGRPKMRHGKGWHRNIMQKIESYFLYQGYEVVREPNLYWGRADLGVYKEGEKDLLIEIGTTSLFKLWINLEVMENFDYLIVPSDYKLIEFTVPVRQKYTTDRELEQLF